MKHSKKFLSLALALALVLALAVPALATSEANIPVSTNTNTRKTFTLEDVNFSVDPIGVAKLTLSEDRLYENVYVFDQDCLASLKDGREFTDYGEIYISAMDGLEGHPEGGPLSHFQFEIDSEKALYCFGFFSFSEDTHSEEYCYMISKAYLDELTTTGLMGWEIIVEFTPLEQSAPGTYTAKQWDTWGELALNNYGTYAVWPQLMKANGNKAVSVGMTITLPEKIGSYARLAPQVLAEGETLYTVKGGDTLGQIALATYGDMSLYKIIYERNKDRLTSPTMIYGGQTLVLPVKPAAQAPAQPAEQTPAGQQPVSFAKGDKVTVREGAKTYTGGNLAGFVYRNTYTVIAVNGDRVVIGVNGVATAAMKAADLVGAK